MDELLNLLNLLENWDDEGLDGLFLLTRNEDLQNSHVQFQYLVAQASHVQKTWEDPLNRFKKAALLSNNAGMLPAAFWINHANQHIIFDLYENLLNGAGIVDQVNKLAAFENSVEVILEDLRLHCFIIDLHRMKARAIGDLRPELLLSCQHEGGQIYGIRDQEGGPLIGYVSRTGPNRAGEICVYPVLYELLRDQGWNGAIDHNHGPNHGAPGHVNDAWGVNAGNIVFPEEVHLWHDRHGWASAGIEFLGQRFRVEFLD